ncbi:ZIP family metal transporter [Deinococcus roseus]|uniref:Metal transporter n=1 Tax=Deinococcus roseus TaxID=392414 RepID=A0ABQ2D2G1_9DEIO|nr:ZIP family metal transporter [Deinococcus roseus]GGJ42362.1 metal transporter [Deinococcus roseus]
MSSGPTLENTSPKGGAWGFLIIPLVLLGVLLAYLLTTGGGLGSLSGPPVEHVTVQRVTLPDPGTIQLTVVNDGPEAITIPQLMVDDAFWNFTAKPSNTIPRFGSAVFTIPYHWVAEEAHLVALMSSTGTVFEHEIPVAVQTPRFSGDLLWRFALIGLYVGIVPIALGVLWYPWMRGLSRSAVNFILSLTVGLLVYLAIGTWLDATEFAAELPTFIQGLPVTILIALLVLFTLLLLGRREKKEGERPSNLSISYRIAMGIGLHNLGEGLAIGAAFAAGEAALGTFLVIGFTLHNITEGVGIAAPILKKNPGLKHFMLLVFIAGFPAVLGTWIGGFAFNPVLATLFLAIGVGAILQVVWEVGLLVSKDEQKAGKHPLNWTNFAGFATGVMVMYFTAFLVKF